MDFFSSYTPPTEEQNMATELCYNAFDTNDINLKKSYAKSALRAYPECVEAWSILGYCHRQASHRDYGKSLRCYERALSHVSPSLKQNPIVPWEEIDNRPYLRALVGKVLVLYCTGREAECIETVRYMLTICPEDNLQVRHILCRYYFLADNLEGIADLVRIYCDEREYVSIDMQCIKLLLYFCQRQAGSTLVTSAMLDKALAAVIEKNPYLPSALAILPCDDPESEVNAGDASYSSSDLSEGAEIMASKMCGRNVWHHVPGALDWLSAEGLRHGMKPDETMTVQLLNSSEVLLVVKVQEECARGTGRGGRGTRQMRCTRHQPQMFGSAMPEFIAKIPPNFTPSVDHANGSPIVVYEILSGRGQDIWREIKYSDIVSIPYWSVLIEDRKNTAAHQAAVAADLALKFCTQCIIDPEEGIKKKKCDACRKLRYKSALCQVCLIPSSIRCSGCKVVFYCGKEHQKQDWKGIHREICRSKRTARLPQSALCDVIVGDTRLLVLEYLVGGRVPNGPKCLLDLISLSKTCRSFRDMLHLPKLRLWSGLSMKTSMDECGDPNDALYGISGENYGDCDDMSNHDYHDEFFSAEPSDDWRWKTKHTPEIIKSFIVLGGRNIISISLQMVNVSDTVLDIISEVCRSLRTFELKFTTTVPTKFPTSQGLVKFFKTVSPLTCLAIAPYSGSSDDNLNRFVSLDVLSAIKSRSFPLIGVNLGVTPITVVEVAKIIASSSVAKGTFRALSLTPGNPLSNNNFGSTISEDILSGQVLNALCATPSNIVGSFLHITTLTLGSFPSLNARHIDWITACMPMVGEFNIDMFSENDTLTDEGAAFISQRWSHLYSLDISGRMGISTKGILNIVRANPGLKDLQIRNTQVCVTAVRIDSLRAIISSAPALLILGCSEIDMAGEMVVTSVQQEVRALRPLMLEFSHLLICTDMHGLLPYPVDGLTDQISTVRETSIRAFRRVSEFCAFSEKSV